MIAPIAKAASLKGEKLILTQHNSCNMLSDEVIFTSRCTMPIIPLKAREVLLTTEPHLLPMLSIILQIKSDNQFSNHQQVACPHWSLKLRACDKYCAAQKSAPVLTVKFPGYLYL